MFPTPVGMNRSMRLKGSHGLNVPHTSGDEPAYRMAEMSAIECSPHQWG